MIFESLAAKLIKSRIVFYFLALIPPIRLEPKKGKEQKNLYSWTTKHRMFKYSGLVRSYNIWNERRVVVFPVIGTKLIRVVYI